MAKSQDVLYAFVGAGDFAMEKIRSTRTMVDPHATRRMYEDFVKRGRALSNNVRRSAPVKQASSQTRTARRQVKAAATSVGKAVRANARTAGSSGTNQAATQRKAASRQVKAAATSVGKAVRANARAVRSATAKSARAS